MNKNISNKPDKGITIYCGSSEGNDLRFAEAATIVGTEIAHRGLTLYYGGGRMGLMGVAGRACRGAGGYTCAIIPQFMVERGWNDPESSETVITTGMHERKELMAAKAIGAIAMPGGVGTFEELTELITWRQLGLFSGNIVILNIARYYDSMLNQFDAAIETGFLPDDHRQLFTVTENPAVAVAIASAEPQSLNLHRKF